MPVNLWNKTNSVEIDINPNLKYTVSKGGFDVIYEDTGAGTPYVFVVLRSHSLISNTIQLDYRECTLMPDETGFDSATELRDALLEWNIPKVSINDSALPSGAATSANQTSGDAKMQIADSGGKVAEVDNTTETLQTIDYAHHEIHSGSHFMYTDAVELNAGATQDYMIQTPDTTKWPHILFDMDGTAITHWQLYEGSDKDGTAEQTVGNNNRNSSTVATTKVYKGTSGGTTDGNLIHVYKSGSATNQSRGPSSARNDSGIILKQNTKYILRVTSGTNANLTNLRLEWYEHTNK